MQQRSLLGGSAWREASSSSSMFNPNNNNIDSTEEQLPTYDPLSQVAQRERLRLRLAQKAVHLIPLLVLLCAIILWFFSAPTSSPTHPYLPSLKITELNDR